MTKHEAKFVKILKRTTNTINAFKNRTNGCYTTHNKRVLELIDRYNAAKSELSIKAWTEYCEDTNSCLSHDGFDLFA